MILTKLDTTSHEHLVRFEDAATGLLGFIAVHSTLLGPAIGGARFRPYATEADAIKDVLKLSKGMTYKNAAADLPLGGGKAAIIGDPKTLKSRGLLRTFGRVVEMFNGAYWTAEDMGTSAADMDVIAETTRFVAGRPSGPFASGDPAPHTARGVFDAIRAAARRVFGSDDLSQRVVAIQGLGNVGSRVAELLSKAGDRLVLSDIDTERAAEIGALLGAVTAEPDRIYDVDADVFTPCAIGGVLNASTIPRLKARIVVGSANNQLATREDGARLHECGVLYGPDYVVNAGGVVSAAAEILHIGDRETWVSDKMAAIRDLLDRIFAEATERGDRPELIAERIVQNRLKAAAAVSRRVSPKQIGLKREGADERSYLTNSNVLSDTSVLIRARWLRRVRG